jgi:hypothetical protein
MLLRQPFAAGPLPQVAPNDAYEPQDAAAQWKAADTRSRVIDHHGLFGGLRSREFKSRPPDITMADCHA